MDSSGEASGGSDVGAEGENCLKEIANNYVEEEDGDNSSGEEIGVGRGDGVALSAHGRGGRHGLAGNGGEECRDSADDSGSDGGRIEVVSNGSGEDHSGESSEEDEEDGDEEDEGVVEGEEEEEEDDEEMEQEGRGQSRGSRGMDGAENGVAEQDRGRQSANGREGVEGAGGAENGVEVAEKSQTGSEGGPESGGAEGGRALRSRRGRPLKARSGKSSVRAAPITPKLEEPRAVRVNRGIKRRFPGDESEDSLPKRIRVRSIASVCGDVPQSVKGEDVSMDDSLEVTQGKKRGRPRKGEGDQCAVKSDEAELSPPLGTGKRKMVEAVLDADSSKRACHGKNGTIFACNAEGCKKRFAEAAALYTHARVHGDRPYVCHYDGCIKSFSERSKLKRHFLIHTGEKPFLCLHEGCGKAFSLDFNLRSHMKTHTGEYNECPYEGCEKRYCQEYKLRAHIAKEHGKAAKGTKKLAKVVGNVGRGTSGSKARNAAAAKKREMMCALGAKRSKLESMREGRVSRMKELEEEKQREAREVVRIEQDLKRVERLVRLVEEGQAGSSGLSLSEEEDADDEEEEEEEEEEEVEEEDDEEEEVEEVEEEDEEAEEPSSSNWTAGDTSSSGEQQSRLEYTAMGEGKDVIMFAHKLPTADQGARLVKTMEARAPESQQEATTSLTPLLWLQGPPPHHGHLAQQSGLRPLLRSRRPGGPDVVKATRALKPCLSLEEKERTPGGSSDSGLGKANGVEKPGGGLAHGTGKGRLNAVQKNINAAGRGGGQPNAKTSVMEKDRENGKVDQKAQGRQKDSQARASKQQGGRASSSEQVFVNPILLSSDHRFSPTDARFLSNHEFPSMAQVLLRDRLSKEMLKSTPVQSSVPKEKVFRSMSEVLHSSANEQGYSGCTGLNDGFGGEQGPSEQSFEPSAAQLFTYQDQSRLVD